MEQTLQRYLPFLMMILGLVFMGWAMLITPEEVEVKKEVIYLQNPPF